MEGRVWTLWPIHRRSPAPFCLPLVEVFVNSTIAISLSPFTREIRPLFLEFHSQEMKFTQCPASSLNMKTDRKNMLHVVRFLRSSSVFLARKLIFVPSLALGHATPPECLGINIHELGRASSHRSAYQATSAANSSW